MKSRVVGCLLVITILAIGLAGCGGGGSTGSALGTGGGGGATASVTGTVTGTSVIAVDGNGDVAASCVATGSPPAFTLTLPPGHRYRFFFVKEEGTPAQRAYLLYDGTTTTFSFLPGKTYNLGAVTMDPGTGKATPGTGLVAQAGVTVSGTDASSPPFLNRPIYNSVGWKFLPEQGKQYLYDGVTGGVAYENRISLGGTETIASGIYGNVSTTKVQQDAYWKSNGSLWHSVTNWIGFVNDKLLVFRESERGTTWNGSAAWLDFPLVEGKSWRISYLGETFDVTVKDTDDHVISPGRGDIGGVVRVNFVPASGETHTLYFHPDYPYNVKWVSSDGESEVLREIRTVGNAPVVATLAASSVTTISAMLNGSVNPNGLPSTAWFEWGTSPTLSGPSTTPTQNVGSGTSSVNLNQDLSGLTEGTTYYYRIASQNSDGTAIGNISSFTTTGSQVSGFTQADLTGTWDMNQFQTSTQAGGSGWFRLVVRFDGNGHGIIDDNTTFEASRPSPVPPNGDTGGIMTMSSSGVVSMSGSSLSSTTFHGTMASNKSLIVGTVTHSATERTIMIFRKRVPGVTYTNADLFNKSFTFHILSGGDRPEWERGDGSINSTGSVTLANLFDSAGLHLTNMVDIARFSITPEGIVTDSLDADYKGFLTPDKKILIGTATNQIEPGVTNYDLMILTISGGSFAQADLAGNWNFHTFGAGASSEWSYGTLTIDASGTGTHSGYNSSAGYPTPPSSSFSITSNGEITTPANSSWHGTISSGKDLICATATTGTGEYNIYLGVK